MKRRRILFIGEGVTLAHVVRPLELARTLPTDEFEVFFACAECYHPLLNLTRSHIRSIASMPPEEFLAILQRGGELFSEATLSSYVDEELALLSELQPDAVVGDLRLSLAVSAPLLGIPYLSLTNAYWSPHSEAATKLPLASFDSVHRLGLHRLTGNLGERIAGRLFNLTLPMVYRKQARGLNAVRKKFRLEPFADYLTGFTFGNLTCFADVPSVAPVRRLPHNQRYIGPVCWSPDCPLPQWWSELDKEKPLIAVSLGSSGPTFLAPVLSRVLERVDAEVVVATAGRMPPESFPSRFRVAEFLPGEAVARQAAFVITNGGSPSSYQSLGAGTPVLGLPLNMDQLLCMRGVSQRGAGLSLRADNVSDEGLDRAVRKLLCDRDIRACSAETAVELAHYRISETFPTAVGELCGSSTHVSVLKEANV